MSQQICAADWKQNAIHHAAAGNIRLHLLILPTFTNNVQCQRYVVQDIYFRFYENLCRQNLMVVFLQWHYITNHCIEDIYNTLFYSLFYFFLNWTGLCFDIAFLIFCT